MATLFAFNRFISVTVLLACAVSVWLAVEIKSGGIDIRHIMQESWPLPRNVVLYNVDVFGPDSGMYKLHSRAADVKAFSEYLYKDDVINAEDMNSLNHMQYAAGCYSDESYRRMADGMPVVQWANYTPALDSNKIKRSVCTCLNNINKVVHSNITFTDFKKEFHDWVHLLQHHADVNFVVLHASEALTDSTTNAYKDLQNQAKLFHDLAMKDKKQFIAKASERCFLSSQPQYVQSYGGLIDTKILVFNGVMFLIFAMLGSVFRFPSEQPNSTAKEYAMLWAVSICYYVYFVLALTWTFNISLRKHVFGGNFRTFDAATTIENADNSVYGNPRNVLQVLYDSIVLIVLGLMSFLFASQQIEYVISMEQKASRNAGNEPRITKVFKYLYSSTSVFFPHSDNLIWKCVQNDLPFIAGYASIGLGLVLSNGVTNVNTAMFLFVVLILVGFVQHMSNVNKIVYDALCQNTTESDMQKLTDYQKKDDEDVKQMKSNLMYLGWTRVLWFLVVSLLTATLLTSTRASTDHTQFSTFFNSHVFWFVVALYWSNVGYDVLRELLPFQFESTPVNQHKVIVTAVYVLYLCWSLSGFMQQLSGTEKTRHLYAD